MIRSISGATLRSLSAPVSARQTFAGAALVTVLVAVAGAILNQGVEAILACVVVGLIATICPPPVAFASFASGGVWKTAAVFGAADSTLPTAALLIGWSASVALHSELRWRFVTAGRASAILLPLTTWLFVSTFVSNTGPNGYQEALRFVLVVVLPSVLVALDIARGRVFMYAAAIFLFATVISVAALGGAAFAGTLWTKESLLFNANTVAFGRVVALGFVAGICLLPIALRRPAYGAMAYGGVVACATAVAHSTSRGSALEAALCGAFVAVLLVVHRDPTRRFRTGPSVSAVATAVAFLVVSAMTFFPTGRGVQTLIALPSELPQFVQVPLLSQSLQTATPTASQLRTTSPTARAPSESPTLNTATTSPSPTTSPDPASVYQSDLSLAYRVERYRIAAAQFMSSPIVGLGYTHGVYARDGQDYAHNLFLEVASELGLVGLACLAVLLTAGAAALARAVSNWETAILAVLLACTFAMAQTSGNLTINRLVFVLCVGALAYELDLRSDHSLRRRGASS